MHRESVEINSAIKETPKQTESVEKKLSVSIKEEQNSSDESPVGRRSKKRRHRASVACASCRDRRIRCVVPSGKKECTQCERSSIACIIKDDDDRRRPISRAYVHSLVERVALLERLLQDQGVTVPSATYPPETRYRVCQGKETPYNSDSAQPLSTIQESPSSDSHITSSPCSVTAEQRDDRGTPDELPRATNGLDSQSERVKKRRRNDSLIAPSALKTEFILDTLVEPALHPSESHTPHHLSIMPLPSANFAWPTATPLYSTTAITNRSQSMCGFWSHDTYKAQSHTYHLTRTEHEQVTGTCNRSDRICMDRATINLDYMPLITDDWA